MNGYNRRNKTKRNEKSGTNTIRQKEMETAANGSPYSYHTRARVPNSLKAIFPFWLLKLVSEYQISTVDVKRGTREQRPPRLFSTHNAQVPPTNDLCRAAQRASQRRVGRIHACTRTKWSEEGNKTRAPQPQHAHT